MQNFGEIFSRLDLDDYLADFSALLARQKPLFLQGDTRVHFENIECLARYEFEAPEEIENLDDALMRLSKQAVLHVKEIAQFARIISYFTYLRSLKFEGRLGEWIAKIEIPPAMSELARGFDKEGELKGSNRQKSADRRGAAPHNIFEARYALFGRYPDSFYKFPRSPAGARRL